MELVELAVRHRAWCSSTASSTKRRASRERKRVPRAAAAPRGRGSRVSETAWARGWSSATFRRSPSPRRTRPAYRSIAIGNFTWDWIYEGTPKSRPPDLCEAIRATYRTATRALRLPHGGGFEGLDADHPRDSRLSRGSRGATPDEVRAGDRTCAQARRQAARADVVWRLWPRGPRSAALWPAEGLHDRDDRSAARGDASHQAGAGHALHFRTAAPRRAASLRRSRARRRRRRRPSLATGS